MDKPLMALTSVMIIIGVLFVFYLVKTIQIEAMKEAILMNESYEEENGTGKADKTYPVHPKISDCEKIEDTSTMNFCLSDAAEISSDIAACRLIHDTDINKFCVARISLDRSLCNEIGDTGLKEACIESVEMKIDWSGGI